MDNSDKAAERNKVSQIIPLLPVKTRWAKGRIVNSDLEVAWAQRNANVNTKDNTKQNQYNNHCRQKPVFESCLDAGCKSIFHNFYNLVRVQRIELCSRPWEGRILTTIRYPPMQIWSRCPDLNRRPTLYESAALPAELQRHQWISVIITVVVPKINCCQRGRKLLSC